MSDEPVHRITLVRHGESVGNAEERLQGHAEFSLSERGRAQVRALAARWKDEGVVFDHVVASPLLRAVETARILSSTLMASCEVEIDPLWIEQDAGPNAGLRWDRIERCSARAGEHGRGQPPAPSAESDAALAARARRAVDSLLARKSARYLVVSHRAFLNAVLLTILGIPAVDDDPRRPTFRIANASFARLRFYPVVGRWQIDALGGHVDPAGER